MNARRINRSTHRSSYESYFRRRALALVLSGRFRCSFSILGLSFFLLLEHPYLVPAILRPIALPSSPPSDFLLSIPSHLPRFPISPSPPMLLPSSTPPPPILIPNLHLPPSLFPMLQRPLFFTCLEIFSFLCPSLLPLPIVSSPPPPLSLSPPILAPPSRLTTSPPTTSDHQSPLLEMRERRRRHECRAGAGPLRFWGETGRGDRERR